MPARRRLRRGAGRFLTATRAEGKFRDVTRAWGAGNVSGKALGVAFADYDGSGRQSLAVANDGMAGDLLKNGGRSFVNVGAASGTAYSRRRCTTPAWAMDWGDYDNDGKLDLVVGTFSHETKPIYQNEGGAFPRRSRTPWG